MWSSGGLATHPPPGWNESLAALLVAYAGLSYLFKMWLVRVSLSSIDQSSSMACDVNITIGAETKTMADAFTYEMSSTPQIDSVTPTRGGTKGGTRITISGSNFGLVNLGRVSCKVQLRLGLGIGPCKMLECESTNTSSFSWSKNFSDC